MIKFIKIEITQSHILPENMDCITDQIKRREIMARNEFNGELSCSVTIEVQFMNKLCVCSFL